MYNNLLLVIHYLKISYWKIKRMYVPAILQNIGDDFTRINRKRRKILRSMDIAVN